MIRNGLYHITVEMLDSVQGGNQGVMVVRDGTLRGGDSFFYAYGTYTAPPLVLSQHSYYDANYLPLLRHRRDAAL